MVSQLLIEKAEFLTLDPVNYPEFNHLPATIFTPADRKFFAAQFYKSINLPKGTGAVAHIAVFADTKFRLSVNGCVIGVGPVAVGGDYGNTLPMPKQYLNLYDVSLTENLFEVLAEVQSPGEVMTDYSAGRGGFVFAAEITFADREPVTVISDESWLCRRDTRYSSVARADFTVVLPELISPVVIPKTEAPWRLAEAGIPPLTEEYISPSTTTRDGHITYFDFSRIYSAYILLECNNYSENDDEVRIFAEEYMDSSAGVSQNPTESVRIPSGKSTYRGLRMRSIGAVAVECSDTTEIKLTLVYVHYPVDGELSGSFICSDSKLNGIYELGKFTLEMCRQSLHLDSPLHQETLGCTGDYAIESLMTAVTFGDMRLTRLDLIRTSDWLRMSNGFMFHTSYSLIFVTMLYDYYIYTADIETVRELMPAVEILIERFGTYIQNGVISSPPSFMFIEWGELDGFSLHHPPKALGQTSLNAFYRMALEASCRLYRALGKTEPSSELEILAEKHKQACISRFYDSARGIFRDGENLSESAYEPADWLPANAERSYYTRHANILAALSGIIDGNEGKELIERVITKPEDFESFDIQPYFMHYLMEAVRKYGLFDRYGLVLIHMWDKQLAASPKGMKEGWNKFNGDCSHAWGATPTYQLPMAVSGFEMVEAGFKSFRLAPCLYSLDDAGVSLPTPYGLIKIELKKGEKAKISVPDEYVYTDGVYHLNKNR